MPDVPQSYADELMAGTKEYATELMEATRQLIQCAQFRHPNVMRGRDARNLGCEDGTDLATKDYAWEQAIERCEAAMKNFEDFMA